jgi:hypothetical protein
MPNVLNLDNQWKFYLEKVGLKEEDMDPIQKSEMKKCFMAACGQMLILLRDEVAMKHTEEEGAKILEDMINQVANFFIGQMGGHN